MVQAVFCAHSSEAQLNKAISKMQTSGMDPAVITVSAPNELDWLATPGTKIDLSLKRGVYGGLVIGALLGVAMLIAIPSLWAQSGATSLIAWESFGWGLFGMIVGSSGVLARGPYDEKLVHHFEQALDEGKILISISVADRLQLDRAAATLYELGAADIHEVAA